MLTYEYKLKGKPEQFAAIDEGIRTVQFIRNKALAYWMDHRPGDGPTLGKYDLGKIAPGLAKEFPFVAKLNSTARQQATERAWSGIAWFYRNCKLKVAGKKGYPRFQRDNRSIEYKRSGWKLSEDCRFITFTDNLGIGTLRLIGKQILNPFRDKIRRVQIVRRADGNYVCFIVAVDRNEQMPPTGSMVGVDLGLTHLWTDSNGEKKANPRWLKASERALKRDQRRLARKQKGSRNRKKQQKKLAKRYLKVTRQRKDFAIKAARALCQSHDLVVLEDLKIQNLVKNRYLAKAINDAAWRQLRDWIECFARRFNKVCLFVSPNYSTQECNVCGAREAKTLDARWHCCPCGCEMDRDHNSAIVLLKRGLKKLDGTPGHGETEE